MKFKSIWLILIGLLVCPLSWADKSDVARGLSVVVPNIKLEDIRETPVEGLYEVTVGPRIIYTTGDGRYVFQGQLLDLVGRQNLTEPALNRARIGAIEAMGEQRMIVFPAKKPTHTITVFSDIDCAYCRKMHSEIRQYHAAGISVRYLLFPRTGVDSPSYDKAVSVWCAKDRNEALTRAKLKDEVMPKTCDNPVQQHMALGQAFGVNGTPAIVTDAGAVLPGYIPAQNLKAYFDELDAQSRP